MAEILGIAIGVAGLLSLAIDVANRCQKFAMGVKGAPKACIDLIREVKSLRNILMDLKDNILENAEVTEAIDARSSSSLRRLKLSGSTNLAFTGGSYLKTSAVDPQGGQNAEQGLVEQCTDDLTRLLAKLKKKSEGSATKVALKRLAWPFTEDEIREALNALCRYRDMFLMSVAIDTLASGAMTHKALMETRQDIGAFRLEEET
jgi:hypothetical protein